MSFVRPFFRFVSSAGLKKTAVACSLISGLLVRLTLLAADSTVVSSDTTPVSYDSGFVLFDSIVTPAGVDSPGLSSNSDSICADSAEGSFLSTTPGESTDSIPVVDTADAVLSPVDTVSETGKDTRFIRAEDFLPAADTQDSVIFPLDSVSVAGETIPEPLVTDTIFDSPQSDNPLALRYNGIYISGATVAIRQRVEKFIEDSRDTPVNGFVIDMKDDQGRLSYTSSIALAGEIRSNTRRLRDPAALVCELHENDLIACARVVAFKDPILASYLAEDSTYPYAVLDSAMKKPWEQDNGEIWANPYDERVHDYLLGVIGELVSFGFDQIQLDYIRFPTDGQIDHCRYPVVIDSLNRADVMGLFLSKVRRKLDGHNVSLAVDVFGWVPWLNKDRNYWIGQDYDVIAGYVDVICPMFYPSHFPKEFKDEFKEKRAYYIVREGTLKGIERRGERSTGLQPYIQGFKWRAPYFGSRYIIDQMRAARESGAVGWIVWNAANNYSPLWQALADEKNERELE